MSVHESTTPYEDYLRRVEVGLAHLPAADRAELIRELASHLEDALGAGTPAEDLFARMGEPETLAAGLAAERLELLDRRVGQTGVARLAFTSVVGPFALVASCVLGASVAIGWLVHVGAFDARGYAVFAAWVALAFAGLSGWPLLARRVAPGRLERPSTFAWMGALGLGLAVAVAYVVVGTHLVFPHTASEAWVQLQQQRADLARLPAGPDWPAEARQRTSAQLAEVASRRQIAQAHREDALRAIALGEADYGAQVLTGASTVGVTGLGWLFGYLRARRIRRLPLWTAILATSWILLAAFFLGLVGTYMASASAVGAAAVPLVIGGLLALEVGLLVLVGAWAASLLRREATHG